MIHIGAVIMASGFSKRFGRRNKLLMPFGEKTVIETVVDQVVASGVLSSIVIVTQYDAIETLYRKNDHLSLVRNKTPEAGITSTMKLGILALDHVDAYMFIAGDQIGITAENIRAIAHRFTETTDSIIVPTYNGEYGSPKIFSASYKDQLMNLQGDIGGKQLINKYSNKIIRLPLESGGNCDIDTEACYRKVKGETL